ncbi:interleukin-1 beta [Xyrichtys novacula]|uniref:Interleukin-1 beta n=1 Tax=Xyrichtys novacula TaxID=13765 RepID=A0AAV1GBS8_XYRNO|nr:interleukin-1 beta [Xyrichtys novacula]
MEKKRDFTLSEALSSSPDFSEEVASETSCCGTMDIQECTLRLEDGLDLVVSCGPKSWCHATVLLASNRFKQILARSGKDLKGNKLCSAILESIVEETVVETAENFSTRAHKFERADSETQVTLSDLTQKSIVLASGGTKLHAVALKSGHENYTVKFTLSRYNSNMDGNGQVVHLSIGNYNLSCCMYQDQAMLMVEQCPPQNLARISKDVKLHRFLFRKMIEGDLVEFESVSCPGWFISTVFEGDNHAVDMCKAGTQRLTRFRMN